MFSCGDDGEGYSRAQVRTPGGYACGLMRVGVVAGYRRRMAPRGDRGRHALPLADVLIALGFGAISVSITVGVVDDPAARAVGVGLAILHVAPLAVRRLWPVLVLGAMAVTGVAYVIAGFPPVGLGPAIVAAVYSVAAYRPRSVSAPAVAGVTLAMVGVVVASGARLATAVANILVFGVAWAVGDRNRQAQQRAAVEHDRVEALERNREELARRAVVEERLRIARELHDVVAHALSVIAVQAGAGRLVVEDSPSSGREALALIETASRSALAEMRRLLRVLRSDEGEVEPLVPSPGLDELEGLVAATVRSGLPVEVRIDGDRVALPAGVDLAGYRIVQEALTNVRKHAHATHVSVTICYDAHEVRIEVLDDGVGPSANGRLGGGHGLVGMRERAALYGGTVETGPGPHGGFKVTARIPCLRETG
jgi:signal transduction histidine kinase